MLSESCLTSTRYIALLGDLLADKNVDIQDVLKGSDLDIEYIRNPDNYLNLVQTESILRNSIELTGEKYLGVELGQRMNVSAHGLVGFVALTASNTRESILSSVKYISIATEVISLRFTEDEQYGYLELVPVAGVPDLVERFFVQTIVSTFDVMMRFLIGDYFRGTYVELAYPPKDDLAKYLEQSSIDIRFNKKSHRIVYTRRALDAPFALADTTAKTQAEKECDDKLDHIQRLHNFSEKIYQQLMITDEAMPSIEDIASIMHVSSRTIRRRLEKEGASYRDLLNKARVEKAISLMEEKDMSITQVAYQLGYGDSANFTRAFKRIVGKTPTEYLASSKPSG